MKKILLTLGVLISAATASAVYAEFAPGQTLDPGCAPTTSTCTVTQITVNVSTGNFGIGTTTPGQKLSVAGDILGNNIIGSYFTATSTTATSTLLAGLNVGLLNVSSTTASSTFANGINLTTGCFSISGSCLATISLSTANTWSALQTFGNILLTGSTTLQNFTGLSATTTHSTTTSLYVSGATTTRIANGVNLSAGCFAINDVCVGGSGGGSGTVNSGAIGQTSFYAAVGTALTATSSLYIATTSYVGINTQLPTAQFEVNGDILFSSTTVGFSRRLSVATSSSQTVPSLFYITNANGFSTANNTGVAGGQLSIAAGNGGVGPSTGVGGSGVGGALTLTGGTGAAVGSAGAGAGGALTITGGAAASTGSGGAAGGALTLTGGAGAGTSVSSGGAVSLTGGAGSGTASGGAVSLTAGANGSAATGAAVTILAASGGSTGGAVSVTSGAVVGSGTGGAVNITGGAVSSVGTGGAVVIAGGAGGGSGGVGGALTISSGNASGASAGGVASFFSGNGGSGSAGGVAQLYAGSGGTNAAGGIAKVYGGIAGSNNQAGGDVYIYGGLNSGSGAFGDVLLQYDGASSFGKVGVGTSTPWGFFSIHATSSIPSFVIGSSTATTFIVAADQSVGIGTSTPWRTFSVNGTMAFNGLTATGATSNTLCIDSVTKEVTQNNAATCTVSSQRFKHDILDLNEGLNAVMALRPVSFKLNSNEEDHIGFIAEEVNLVDPRLVFYDSGTTVPRGVRYEEVTALLAKAIQEQQIRIQALESGSSGSGGGGGISFASVLSSLEALGTKITDGLLSVKNLLADQVTTKKLCLEEVCVTKVQLQTLLQNANIQPDQADITDVTQTSADSSSGGSIDTEAPTITIVGNNPANLTKGETYLDHGATVVDNVDQNLGLQISGDQIDTTISGTYTITYTATDQAGNTATSTRQVIVSEPTSDDSSTEVSI